MFIYGVSNIDSIVIVRDDRIRPRIDMLFLSPIPYRDFSIDCSYIFISIVASHACLLYEGITGLTTKGIML